ncbi:MAG: lamin tail domain-containing protein, partial [Ferruginibacter sp.]|nr:lamin tail domain-containing protein [Ferruginibacter sp.]
NYDGQGGEWTELYNPTGSAVDIGKWILTDGEEIISFPMGTTIPAGGFFLIYNSNFFACNTCNWDATINSILTSANSLNLATCGCTNQTASSGYAVTWDNGLGSTNQDRVILFKPDGTIADAVYYGSGERYAPAASPILESVYAPGGALTVIGANTYDGSINFDVPALTNPVWKYIGPVNVGCTSSFGRTTDGGSTWFTDYFPSPLQTNVITDYTFSVNGTPITGTNLGGTLVINTCTPTTYLFSVDVPGYNKVYRDFDGDDGDAIDNTTTLPAFPNAEGGSPRGGSTINATGGVSLTNQAWATAAIASGVTTLTYTSPTVSSSTLFTLRIKENTQGPIDNPNESGFNGSTISGNGQAAECYIEQKVQINFITAITAASFTCVNGLATVTTTPASGTGTLLYELMNGATVLESNTTGKFFIPTGSPATGIRVTQSGTGCGGTITATGSICTAPPLCPNPYGEKINGGTTTITACPTDNITLSVCSASRNLPIGGKIEWYNSTTSSFNPYNNEGTLIGESAITSTTSTPTCSYSCPDLSPGDIAFIDIQTDDDDRISFIVLNPIAPNAVFYFTDNGWTGTAFSTFSEGAGTYTAPVGGLAPGTIVTINITSPSATTGTFTSGISGGGSNFTGAMALAVAGDQCFAFCGTPASPNFIAGIHTRGAAWDAGATSSNHSALPSSLSPSFGVAIGSDDNGIINCATVSLTGTVNTIASSINTNTNWTTSNTRQATPPACSFVVTFTAVADLVYSIPESFCNQTTYIKGIVKTISSSCSTSDATTPTFQVNVTCPTASITGQSAVCGGSATTIPVTLTNTGSCTEATVNFSINGIPQTPQGPLTITGGSVNLTGITTPGIVTINSVTLSNGCGAGTCMVKVSGEHTVSNRNNPAAPTATPQNACIGDVVQIAASGSEVINWYSDAAGTTFIGAGTPFYYTAAGSPGTETLYLRTIDPDNGCQSAISSVVITKVTPPTIQLNGVSCRTGNLSLGVVDGTSTFTLVSKNAATGDPVGTNNTTGLFNLIGNSTATFRVMNTAGCIDIIDLNFVTLCGWVLSLDITNFNVEKRNAGNLINWKTTGEESVIRYSVETSIDRINFVSIHEIASKNTLLSTYSFIDNRSINAKKVYYRIKAINKDGSVKYSEVKFVLNDLDFTLTVAPNPTQNNLSIHLTGDDSKQIKISNSAGATLVNQNIGRSTNIDFDISKWNAGVYYIEVTCLTTKEKISKKIIKAAH